MGVPDSAAPASPILLGKGEMRSVSDYNLEKKFLYEFRESRLKKAARMIAALAPGKLLDIGCSRGDWGLYWKERGWTSYGLDIDAEHAGIATRRGVPAKVCDLNAEPIPYPDGSFDLIFAGEVIEHLVDTDGFLQELHRCLRPGGHLILTTPNLASFENRIRILLGIYPIWVDYRLEGSGHVRAYTPPVLKKQLREHGFRILKHTGNWVPFLPQRLIDDVRLPALSLTGSVFPSLAMDIIVMARKEAPGL
jgi:SAM-dependent methyltransferase